MSGPVTVREAPPSSLEQWDRIVQRFPRHRVVHTRAWIESLAAAGYGRPLYLQFEQAGEIVGCLPGLLTSVGGCRLFGSPMAGWQTVSMGPVFREDRVTTAEVLATVVPFLERKYGVAYIEMSRAGLDALAMQAWGFEGRPVFTWRVPLYPGDEDRVFRAMKDSARRNVRRAERLQLVMRFEENERFVDTHYAQLTQVYRRRGHAIPFRQSRVLDCFRRMRGTGHLLATAVYLPRGRVCIATGMFLIQGAELLLWTWAHDPQYRWYRGTELMTWMAMKRAMEAGCESFDLMGAGEFKKKFCAEPDQTKWRWMRGRPSWLIRGRDLAESAFRFVYSVRGHAARTLLRTLQRDRPGRAQPLPACAISDIDLVDTLGLGGIRSAVAARAGSPSPYSRYTTKRLAWPDPAEEPERALDVLLAYSETQPQPPVLYYDDDASLLLISRNRDRLQGAFRFVMADAQLVEQLVDKSRFQELARRLDLPVPQARTLLPAEHAAPPDLEFPLLLKPLTRRPREWEPVAGRGKAMRIESMQALDRLWPSLARARLAVLAQKIVPGPEMRIESHHLYVDETGEVVAEFTGRKIRTRPTTFGDSTAVETTNAGDVAELGREIVKRLRLRGVAKLDFKRAPDGRLFLLEVNPRFTLWLHVGAHAGVNIPALVYDDLMERPRRQPGRARAGVRWCKVWQDPFAARSAGVPLAGWLRWFAGCEAKSALAWHDPFPLLFAGWHRLVSPRTRPEPALATVRASSCSRAAPVDHALARPHGATDNDHARPTDRAHHSKLECQ